MRYVFNVIASVGRQNYVYRPIKIQKSYRPTVFFNVILASRIGNNRKQISLVMRKPFLGVTDKVWHKLGYTVTEDGSYGIHCNGCAIYIAKKINGADLQKEVFS